MGLVTGLAMTVVRDVPWVIPTQSYPAPPKPVPKPQLTRQVAHPSEPDPTTIDRPPIDIPTTFPTDTMLTIDTGPTLPPERPQVPLPPQHAPATDQSASALPTGNSGDWVIASDYPPAAERADAQGRTVFHLDIGLTGRVTTCTVLASSGYDDLDQAACRLLISRARFKAARDADGHSTVGSYSGGITWKIPAD